MFKFKSTVERSAERLLEEKLYEQVALELQEGNKSAGIWAKALANSNGSEVNAQSLYIQYHVQALKDEMILNNELSKKFTPPQEETQQKQYKTEEEKTKDIILQNTKDYEHFKTKKVNSSGRTEQNVSLPAFIILSVIIILILTKGLS